MDWRRRRWPRLWLPFFAAWLFLLHGVPIQFHSVLPSTPAAAPSAMASELPLILRGTIQRWRGNQLPGPGRGGRAAPAAAREVVVVEGRIQPARLGDPFLPADQLQARILGQAISDARGSFQITLAPPPPEASKVTVFLSVCGGYYLNRFSGSGHFAALSVPEWLLKPLVLVDDREAAL